MAKINLGFNSSSFFFFFSFLVGPLIGLNPLTGPADSRGGGSGPPKKTQLVNGPGSGHES